MDKKIPPKINVIPEEKKKPLVARKELKNKAPLLDPRRGSRIAIDAVSAVIVDRVKTSRDLDLISNALNKHFIFTSLSNENRLVVISHMKLYTMSPKEVVFNQGSSGSLFFVVASGKLEILVNNKRVNVLGVGDSFGELALLHDSPRSASVITIEKVSMWGLERKSFRSAVETVNADNYKENKNFIETVPLFSMLTPMQRDSLVGSLSTLKFRPSDTIIKEGDPGDLFYIIKDGKVSCHQHGVLIREMNKGTFFGEQALLYHTVRTATVTAITDVKCVAISRNKLTNALGNNLQQIIYQNTVTIAFERSPFLKELNPKQKQKLMNSVKIVIYNDGDIVIRSDTLKAEIMLVVLLGSLRSQSGKLAEVFQCLGDMDISRNITEFYHQNVFAVGETHVAEIHREEFESCIDTTHAATSLDPEAISALRAIHLLKSIPPNKFTELTNCLKVQSFDDKDTIIQQNTPGDSFFIIKSGKVDIVQDGVTLRTVTKHDYFGERSILTNDFRTASVIANGSVSLWVLNKNDFNSILEESLRNALIKRIELQDDSITLKDLVVVKKIGQGNFGNVFLVCDKNTRRLYALKSVSRKKIERYEMQENLILERKILLTLDHIFILKLVKSFKDVKRIYFLTEFVRGCDLFDVLRDMNILSDRDAKFFTACLVIILEYLHERDVLYRDLKPENVMVDEDGYLKLIDFGISKILNGRTYTIVGTPHYMAPEVILGKGYSLSADYWSLGVMLYEFLCCAVPFAENEDDPYVVYEKVLERNLVYPGFIDSKMPAKPLIEQLLSKNPVLRNGGSVEILKAHRWFTGMNWESLIGKVITSPYKPTLPELDKDIGSSMRSHMTIEEHINKEEELDDVSDGVNRKPRNIPAQWDTEF